MMHSIELSCPVQILPSAFNTCKNKRRTYIAEEWARTRFQLRKKISIAERLARRPGPRNRAASEEIAQPDQALTPKIGELNRELTVYPLPARRGAPKGNQNRLVHGRFTAKRLAFMAQVRTHTRYGNWLVRQARALMPATQSGRRAHPVRYITERIGR
jgi:hypothetical protein